MKFCTEITVSERVVSLKLFDVLFVNVYMPCEDGSITALNMIHGILANVSNNIELSEAKFIIFGGDINTNITSNSSHALAINDFLLTYKMKIGNTLLESKNETSYTFGNEKLNRYSSIDFLCVSESLLTGVKSYNVMHDAVNHSDHLPVTLRINIPQHSDFFKFCVFGLTPEKLQTSQLKHE